MEKVIVDESVCIGCGFCAANKPEVFDMNDDGYAFTKEEKNKEINDEIMETLEGCPVGAIKLINDEK